MLNLQISRYFAGSEAVPSAILLNAAANEPLSHFADRMKYAGQGMLGTNFQETLAGDRTSAAPRPPKEAPSQAGF